MKIARSLSWLVAVVGLWEAMSPYILDYTTTTVAVWNAFIIGVVLIVLAAWAALSEAFRLDRNLEWINAVLGVWLILSPFALNYSAVEIALWNNLIVGVVTIALAAWAATTFGRPAPQA
jgi:hypothetical protein